MDIFKIIKSGSTHKKSRIGIGLGRDSRHNEKIIHVALRFLEKTNSEIFIYGKRNDTMRLLDLIPNKNSVNGILLISNINPELAIFHQLTNNKLDAIVRGSFSSSNFLQSIKMQVYAPSIDRLALLETYDGNQFFYGPVGIDECNDYAKKKAFIQKALQELKIFNITPKVSVLSGGRLGDKGRDKRVDETIQEAEKLVEFFRKEEPQLEIFHDEILIEKAIKKKANLIIAPEGISGNLIYRTLVHLGGGKAYGAIYMGLDYPIIDTSRVGKRSEIYGALNLAHALAVSE